MSEKEGFRDYTQAPQHVKDTYYLNHTLQTLDFVKKKHLQYFPLKGEVLSLWEAFKLLDQLVDESDPDTKKSQTHHALQTAEAIRKDGHPRWLILTGLVHDMGKILAMYGEPQWAVVGDTFPVGCRFEDSNIFVEFFNDHPDSLDPIYKTSLGIYSPYCGFNSLWMSFGHDEYIYQVMKPYLPKEALYILRFHSFYPAHFAQGYKHLMSDEDHMLIPYLKLFQKYDLYSKHDEEICIDEIYPYYEELVNEFLPKKIQW